MNELTLPKSSETTCCTTNSVSNAPLVSVIITAYNRREFLLDAIRSVVRQNIPKDKFEVIVIKNFSDTVIDREIKLLGFLNIVTPEIRIGKMILEAIQASRGEILSFLDDDDLFLPCKLSSVVDAFSRNPKLAYYKHGFVKATEGISAIHSRPERRHGDRSNVFHIHGEKNLARAVRLHAPLNLSSISIKKNVIMTFAASLSSLETAPDFFAFYSAVCSADPYFMIDAQQLSIYRLHKSTTRVIESDGQLIAKHLQEYGILIRRTFQSMLSEMTMPAFAKQFIVRSISSWKVQSCIVDATRPTRGDFINAVMFSISRRSVEIFLAAVISFLLPHALRHRFSRAFLEIHQKRVRDGWLL